MKEIRLTNGDVTVVDSDIYEYLNAWNWRNHRGYAVRTSKKGEFEKRKELTMSRVVYELKVCKIPDGMVVDHKSMDTLDNRLSNLRLATRGQNASNRKRQNNNLTSLYKGVTKRGDNYIAQVSIDGASVNLGMFSSEEAAGWAYNHKAIEYFGEFARLNDIEPHMSEEEVTKFRVLYGSRGKNKFRGVTKSGSKWLVRITGLDKKVIYLGSFNTEEDGLNARNEFLIKHPELLRKYPLDK